MKICSDLFFLFAKARDTEPDGWSTFGSNLRGLHALLAKTELGWRVQQNMSDEANQSDLYTSLFGPRSARVTCITVASMTS